MVHIFRESNFVVDCLVDYARGLSLGLHRLHIPPSQMLDWIIHDRIGVFLRDDRIGVSYDSMML